MIISFTLGVIFGAMALLNVVLFAIKNIRELLRCSLFLTLPLLIHFVFPLVSKLTIGEPKQIDLSVLYLSFIVTLALGLAVVYLSSYKSAIKRYPVTSRDFLDFLLLSNTEFKDLLRSEPHHLSDIISVINKKTPGFVDDLYSLLSSGEDVVDDLDGEEMLIYVLFLFNDTFLETEFSRFTIRELDEDNLVMKTIKTTREDSPPGDIDITKINIITKSMQEKKPILYSKHKANHFKTKQNSLEMGLYDDYASYCLMTKSVEGEDLPWYSVCIDVKGHDLVAKLNALVDHPVFEIMCARLSEKLHDEKFAKQGAI
ncbi:MULTISPECIES: hypothetical protein [Pseudoalteromonas]|uniref:Uncharacterized protein n=1 Tax=Pseudoalteromonas rubra TaxID=43658 RepID=A0A7S7YS21_9GAMM|nr:MULTISPECIES: hypothetical protein [Pseudoalteromonas]MCG7560798.1 hypothetical protein [Pseudoalteromonas sp. McH1-42]MEC4090545.1 hypothetical protein [Pseudoalteromonas rubra]QPB82469.1 hypothetical protein CWC22_005500 [Pseudoalteromonas rubra]